MSRRRLFAVLFPIAIGIAVALTFGSAHRGAGASAFVAADKGPGKEIHHDKSKQPLRDVKPVKEDKGTHVRNEHRFPRQPGSVTKSDPVVQQVAPAVSAPTQGVGFDAMTATDGSQTGVPPDPNAAVGPDQIVEVVNTTLQVYSKTGTPLLSGGPVDTNTLWSGFDVSGPGEACGTNNNGDGTVAYDRLDDRWVVQQFSLVPPYGVGDEYLECIAVSTSGDATGTWYRYAFGGFGDEFPDYPKLAVWPDGYYSTFNLFAGAVSFDGVEVCAYERAKMLIGQDASQQCNPVNDTNLNGLLPSDADGSTPPPDGSPNYLLGLRADSGTELQLYKFHVDWTDPSSSTFTGSTITVPAFNLACGGSNCIPQKKPAVKPSGTSAAMLDSLGDRLMYRLAYRNFGDHESLVVTHSVSAGATTGIRWYEIRDPGGAATVYQNGTFAPNDAKYRWMGSAAMDKNGDIALGYSISNSSMFPSIAVTGRKAGDPLDTMTLGETVLKAGAGSQLTDSSCDQFYCSLRWGDYTSMSVDPSDDCTMWYTNQYEPVNTSSGDNNFNWHTWIGSFDLCNATAGGGGGGGAVNDFSLSANPASLSIKRGKNSTTKILTAKVSGAAEKIALTVSGKPSGVSTSLSSKTVTAGSSSKLSVTVGKKTAVGVYTLVVTGTAPSATHQVPVTLTVK